MKTIGLESGKQSCLGYPHQSGIPVKHVFFRQQQLLLIH